MFAARLLRLRNRPSRGAHIERYGLSLQLNLRGQPLDGALLEVRQDLVAPIEPLLVGTVGSTARDEVGNVRVNADAARRKHALRRGVVLNRHAHLLQSISAIGAPSGFPRRLNRREQQGHEHADNRDDDEKFDERKTTRRERSTPRHEDRRRAP